MPNMSGMQSTPSPASTPLPLSSRPSAFREEYADQHGWSPFDEGNFVYAARAALDNTEDYFRQLMSKRGGLWEFWNKFGLPFQSAPRKDTRGLTLWEIDDVLNSIGQQASLPEPVRSRLIDHFKSRVVPSSSKLLPRISAEQQSHHGPQEIPRGEDMDEAFDDSLLTRDGASAFDDEGSSARAGLSSGAEGIGSESEESTDCCNSPIATAAKYGPMTEKEKMAKVSKILQNLKSKKSRISNPAEDNDIETIQTSAIIDSGAREQQVELEGGDMKHLPRPGVESQPGHHLFHQQTTQLLDGSVMLRQRGPKVGVNWPPSSTLVAACSTETTASCSAAPNDSMDEDERYCQGIV